MTPTDPIPPDTLEFGEPTPAGRFRRRNVVAGLATARARGLATIGLTGADGGPVRAASDVCIEVPSSATPRIQEAHTLVAPILCELVERALT